MAGRKTHMEDCERVLGEPFEYVHKWMDEFAKKYPPPIYLEYHRKFRHNAEGVKEVGRKWGFYAERAAKLHIIRDNEMYLLKMKTMDIMREDEIDPLYEQALKYCHY
jgi:hypothetical protein